MGFTLQLLGRFSIVNDATSEPLPTRSYGRIYALLALHMKAGMSRKELIQTVWPDLDFTTASNRLRVALSTFRRDLGSGFMEDGSRIGLNSEFVTVDMLEAQRVLDSLQDEIDEAHELRLLEEKVELFGQTLLPEFDDEWVEPWRATWTGIALESVRRICTLATKANDHRLVVRAIEAAFIHEPFDDALWRDYLEANSQLGEKTKALAHFAQARRTFGEQLGGDFEPETVDFATNLRDAPFSFAAKGEQPLTPKEVELYARVVARIVKDDPEIACALFGSRPAFFEESSVQDVALPLLTRLTEETDHQSIAWQKCTLNLLSLHANRGDLTQILSLGQQILDVSADPVVRGTTLAYLSFAHLTNLDYGGALSTIERCIETLVESGHDDEAKVFYLNKAAALIAMGRHQEAAHLSQEAIDYFVPLGNAISDIRVIENRHTLTFCLVLMERYEEASAEARQVIDTILARQYEPSYGNGLSFSSYVVYKTTRNASAVDTAIMSLKAAYRSDNVITQLRALEYIAGIIQEAGFGGEARALLEYADQWRLSSSTLRQQGHQVIVDRMLAICGDEALSANLEDATPRDVLTHAIRVLRQII